jgi:hypothetical protein
MATRRPRRPHAPLPIATGNHEPTDARDTPMREVTHAETPPGRVGADGGESVLVTPCIALQHFLEQHHVHGWVRGGAVRVAEERYRAWACCACGTAWEH